MKRPSTLGHWLAAAAMAGTVGWSAPEVAGPWLELVPGPLPGLRLTLTNASDGQYAIERSTDLRSWVAAQTLVLAATPSGSLSVTNQQPAEYFRAVARPSVTQGRADTVVTSLLACAGARVAGVGTIAATDGTVWTVPAANSFAPGPKAADLYNDCSGFRPPNISAVNLDAVPIVEVDPGGRVITGFLFADNYFELYVNGRLVAVDPVPYTPFNACVVRFRARAPVTYAIRLVDWEENLGLGSESNRGDAYHAGDGGLMASFSDGTVTDARWKAQTFYIAPLASTNCVVERADGTRQSAACPASPGCGENCLALHYPVPPDWFAPTFDDSRWPAATTYLEEAVGVDNKPAYLNFPAQFRDSGAKFIWSSNLVLDNEVLVRFTTR